MPDVTTRDGRRLAYQRAGVGPLVVAHPGGPGFAGRALRDLGGLGEHVDLVRIDPRGTGASDQTTGDYEIAGYVDDLVDLLDHLGQRPHAILGHSHGGVVVLTFAVQQRNRCDQLVLLSTPTHLDADRIDMLGSTGRAVEIGAGTERGPRRLVRLGPPGRDHPTIDDAGFPTWGTPGRRYVPALHEEDVAPQPLIYFNDHVMRTYDLRTVVPGVDEPTLVVSGRHDVAVPPSSSWELTQQLPRGTLAIIEDSGHVPYLENPGAFHDAVVGDLGV